MQRVRIATLLLAFTVASCTTAKDTANDITGGWGLDLPFFELVRECDATTEAVPQELVLLELCSPLDDLALARSLNENGYEGATCWPTSRHAGPCLWCCGDDCGPGSNAHSGQWCPDP